MICFVYESMIAIYCTIVIIVLFCTAAECDRKFYACVCGFWTKNTQYVALVVLNNINDAFHCSSVILDQRVLVLAQMKNVGLCTCCATHFWKGNLNASLNVESPPYFTCKNECANILHCCCCCLYYHFGTCESHSIYASHNICVIFFIVELLALACLDCVYFGISFNLCG